MTILLILFGSAAALELLVHLFGRLSLKWLRTVLTVAALISGGLAAGALVMMVRFNVFGILVALLSVYRLINLIRIVEARMNELYLRRATLRTSLVMMLLQFLVATGWWAWAAWHESGHGTWGAVGAVQAVAAALLLVSTLRSVARTRWPSVAKHYSDKELPTVTIAIPARNETEDLEQCLQSVINSDYPKLEVVVLDDCSQLKRTPEIIKAFAHNGVRFVQGEEPRESWLPKNQAYDRLAAEATGEYILCCGVDVRFSPQSVRHAVSVMMARRKKMLSLLPKRQQSAYGHFSLIQAMRYWWELAPPRRLFRRPPVLSSCWIIEATALRQAGGFAAVSRSIVPEAHFARVLVASDSYSFLRSDDRLGIESNKHVRDQTGTAVRMRYPQVHRRPEQAAIAAMTEAFFLLTPFCLAIGGFWLDIGPVAHGCALVACAFLVLAYELIVLSTRVNTWWFGLLAQPFAVLVDIGLLHYSLWKYEFSTVDWKGRNVCIPVMHVEPHLPLVK